MNVVTTTPTVADFKDNTFTENGSSSSPNSWETTTTNNWWTTGNTLLMPKPELLMLKPCIKSICRKAMIVHCGVTRKSVHFKEDEKVYQPQYQY